MSHYNVIVGGFQPAFNEALEPNWADADISRWSWEHSSSYLTLDCAGALETILEMFPQSEFPIISFCFASVESGRLLRSG